MYSREYAKQCVGNGWHGLIDEAYDLCERYGVEVTQVKEKFGQLRIYTGIMTKESSDVLDPKIWAIEEKSRSVCESRGGWLKSICNTCKDINDVLAKA